MGEPASSKPKVLPHRPLARSLREAEKETRTRPERPRVPRPKGSGPGGRARLVGEPRYPGLGAEPKDSGAEPRMTEGGAHES